MRNIWARMKHQYELDYEKSASRAIKKVGLDRDRNRIQAAINALACNPRPRGCENLTIPSTYRIRVGDWRVIYTVNDSPDFAVVISKVVRRNERTYKK